MQVVPGEESDESGSSLHKFTVVLLVLGCLGLVLVIITVVLVIVRYCSAAVSGAAVFCKLSPSVCSRRRQGAEQEVVVGVVDTSYVVGQDYRPHNLYSGDTASIASLEATIHPGGRGGRVYEHLD